MKIAEILEIADKRTPGEWRIFHDEDSYQPDSSEPHTAVLFSDRAYDLICDNTAYYPHQVEVCNMEYIAIASEMESKLRTIHELMPEIKKNLQRFIAIRNASGVDTKPQQDLLKQLEVWENE